MNTNLWIREQSINPNARLRLFCFPYAGGAAPIFRTWDQHLPASINVCPVHLPGRATRIREKPFTNLENLVQAFLPSLQPCLDKPFAIFGHSMGSLIAYEVTKQLHQQGNLMPTYLLVSGRRAPYLPDPEMQLHTLPNDELFLKELRHRYDNVPDAIFDDAELRALFLPLLRADFTLVETYQSSKEALLPCPIIAFGGQSDSRASQAELMAWKELTQSDFDVHLFPGGHFYLNEQAPSLLQIINGYLS
ncbi:MAG: alpha/beta fold hydrolase [Chloroflexota bacterium]